MHALRTDPPAATDALEAWVRRHQTAVWRFLRALGCPLHEADDLTQDTFLLALDRRQHERDDASAAAFLRQTAKHLWLHRRRDDQRRAQQLLAAAEQLWQRDCAHDDGAGWLETLELCLQSLASRSRRALELFYGEQKTRAELAAELGIGEHGARTLLQRVRAFLKDCVNRRRRA